MRGGSTAQCSPCEGTVAKAAGAPMSCKHRGQDVLPKSDGDCRGNIIRSAGHQIRCTPACSAGPAQHPIPLRWQRQPMVQLNRFRGGSTRMQQGAPAGDGWAAWVGRAGWWLLMLRWPRVRALPEQCSAGCKRRHYGAGNTLRGERNVQLPASVRLGTFSGTCEHMHCLRFSTLQHRPSIAAQFQPRLHPTRPPGCRCR